MPAGNVLACPVGRALPPSRLFLRLGVEYHLEYHRHGMHPPMVDLRVLHLEIRAHPHNLHFEVVPLRLINNIVLGLQPSLNVYEAHPPCAARQGETVYLKRQYQFQRSSLLMHRQYQFIGPRRIICAIRGSRRQFIQRLGR